MKALLPVGAYVRVTEKGDHARPSYIAKVAGYDMGRTKYRLAPRYGGWGRWLFHGEAIAWAGTSWVEEITEAEATAIPIGNGKEN
jgi:hypothetical protein